MSDERTEVEKTEVRSRRTGKDRGQRSEVGSRKKTEDGVQPIWL